MWNLSAWKRGEERRECYDDVCWQRTDVRRHKELPFCSVTIWTRGIDSHSPTWRSSDQHPPGVAHSSPAPSGKCCKHTNTHKHIVKDQTVRLISFFMHQLFSCFYYNRKPKKTKKNSEYKLAFPEIQQNKGTTKCLKHLKSVLYHPVG